MSDPLVDSTTTQTGAADTTVDTILTSTIPDEGAAAVVGGAAKPADKAGEGVVTKNEDGAADATKADGAEGTKKPDDTKAEGVPESYEFKVPEGFTLDTALVEKITPILKAKGFTQEEAQTLADTYAESKAADVQQQQQAWQNQLKTWRTDIQADPEFGGDNYKSTVKAAQTVIARYGDDQLKKELADFGVGNMPSLIKLLARAGRDMSEDNFHGAGGARGGEEVRPEQVMFPTMNQK